MAIGVAGSACSEGRVRWLRCLCISFQATYLMGSAATRLTSTCRMAWGTSSAFFPFTNARPLQRSSNTERGLCYGRFQNHVSGCQLVSSTTRQHRIWHSDRQQAWPHKAAGGGGASGKMHICKENW